MAREQIEIDGSGWGRARFVLDAAAKLAAAVEANVDCGFEQQHDRRSAWAFDAAEALWAEACKRFPEQEEEG